MVNASISGDTTTGGLGRLPRALKLHRPDIVLIELGGNDGLRGTPIGVMRDNLSEMIRLAKSAGARVLIAGMRIPPNYGQRYTEEFAALYPQLAKEHGVAFIPFVLDGIALDRTLMQADGIVIRMRPVSRSSSTTRGRRWKRNQEARLNRGSRPSYLNALMWSRMNRASEIGSRPMSF